MNIISKNLNVEGSIYDIIEAYLNYKNKHLKIYEKEYENQLIDYRDEDIEEKENYINEKLGEISIHQILKQMKLDDILWDFDAVSLYASAMWDENSIYSRIGTGYAYTENMNYELVEKVKTGNLTQGSAILKIKYYHPKKNQSFNIFLLKKKKRKLKLIV